MKQIFIILALFLITILVLDYINPNKLRLVSSLLTDSLAQVKADYAKQDCTNFTNQEKQQGYFFALVTGYCQPHSQDFDNRHDFLCAVGLNCSCPNGRTEHDDCFTSGSMSWSSCLEFDDTQIEYCHQTAAQTKPQPGQIAADWQCFTKDSTINIDNQNYIVTDKGSAITGRRFDIWFDDCTQALKTMGIYKVKIPHI